MKRLIPIVLFCAWALNPGSARAQAEDTGWLLQNSWFFENFDDTNVSWNVFRLAFIGVSPTESSSGNFDLIFYNDLFKNTLYNPGNCFGMQTLAMLIKQDGGYLGYCYPPHLYAPRPAPFLYGPQDPMLKQAIEVTHGNQINQGFLSFLLDVVAGSHNRDGNYAFDQVHYYFMQGDQPVLSITEDLSPADGGHVVIPYFEDTVSSSERRIYVYDPNRSIYAPATDSDHIFYSDGFNFVDVLSNGTWSYHQPSPYTTAAPWTGNPGGGGNCIAVPISVAGAKDRLPQSLFADANLAIGTIFIFAKDMQVRQITDLRNHRRFLNRQGTDAETDPRRRLGTVLPFIPLDGAWKPRPGNPSAVYFVRGNHPYRLSIRVRGAYKVAMIYGGHYVEYKGVGDGSVVSFRTPPYGYGPARLPKATVIRDPAR